MTMQVYAKYLSAYKFNIVADSNYIPIVLYTE